MALVIRGQTTCRICGRPMLEDEVIAGFPPFVANEADPLHFFSDGAFHEACFALDPRAAEARRRVNELRTRTGPGARHCAACGDAIRDSDDYFSFGYLAMEPRDVRALNYLQFHRRHLPQWSGLGAAHRALLDLEASGTWRGPALRWLIEQLEAALRTTAS